MTDILDIKQEPVDPDPPCKVKNFGKFNKLSKSIFEKLNEVFGNRNSKLDHNIKIEDVNSIDLDNAEKRQHDYSTSTEHGDIFLVNDKNNFDENYVKKDSNVLDESYLPSQNNGNGQNVSENPRRNDVILEIKQRMPVLKNILNSKPVLEFSVLQQNDIDYSLENYTRSDNDKSDLEENCIRNDNNKFDSEENYMRKGNDQSDSEEKNLRNDINDCHSFDDDVKVLKVYTNNNLQKNGKTEGQNKKKPNKAKTTSITKKKTKRCTGNKKVLKTKMDTKILNKTDIKKEPMNSVNKFDIREEVKDISRLIKEEIAGLIKSEVKFEMSHVPEFPNMAKTHSEANLYMKSYMHNTTFASGTIEIDKPCCCQYCGKVFVSGQNLVKHLEQHVGDRPHVCDVCGKTFKIRQNLRRHYMIHTGEKPYKCQVCDKAFATYTTFSKHKLVHTGEKNHECDICGKKFAHKTNMKSHRLLHLEDRPFKCHICHKGFNKNANLRSHMKVHLGVKPHKCEYCGKGFPEKYQLTMHVRSHTNERPYACNICDRRFNQVSNLYTHMRFTVMSFHLFVRYAVKDIELTYI